METDSSIATLEHGVDPFKGDGSTNNYKLVPSPSHSDLLPASRTRPLRRHDTDLAGNFQLEIDPIFVQ